MTLKEIKEQLEIKSDINNLSVEQLREKYKKTPEDYERVASIFADMFTKRGSLYSLCVEKEYEKIKEFFKDEDKENNRRILKRMYDEMQAPGFSKNADQAEAVYCQGLGADALIEGRNFPEVIDMVLKGVKLIEKSNFKNTKGYNETYLAYIREIGSALEKGETNEANKLISELENVHPGLLLCNNVNFLLATNYLLQTP